MSIGEYRDFDRIMCERLDINGQMIINRMRGEKLFIRGWL